MWRAEAWPLPTWPLALALALGPGLSACRRAMYDQPRYRPFAAAPGLPLGMAAQPPVTGTVPYQGVDGAWEAIRAASSSGRFADTLRPAGADRPLGLVERGRERYQIYCAPCHGATGDGLGPIVRHGFPRPPSLGEAALVRMPDDTLDSVAARGKGAMYGFADVLPPGDRRAVVAWMRVLQASGAATAGAEGAGGSPRAQDEGAGP